MLQTFGHFGRLTATCAALVALASCLDQPAGKLVAERVDVPAVRQFEGQPIVGRFYVELSPLSGTMNVFRLHHGDLIYREAPMASGAVFNFNVNGGTVQQNDCDADGTDPTVDACPPLNDVINLYTDQSRVTYVDASGTCYNNGQQWVGDTSCHGLYPDVNHVCRAAGVFCGPLRMISAYRQGGAIGALPNVILDIDQTVAGSVETCRDLAAGGLGSCAKSGGANPAKISAITSNFTPAIPAGGGTSEDTACALCYGNDAAVTAAGVTGLRNVVMSGVSTQLSGYNTDIAAIKIPTTSEGGLNVTLDVRYSTPSFEPAGFQLSYRNAGGGALACYTPESQGDATTDTQVELFGSGFGPQAECFSSNPPATCSSTTPGTAEARYRLQLDGQAAVNTPAQWSDAYVRSSVLADGAYGCGVQVRTPAGNRTTDDELAVCTDTWRRYVPALAEDSWSRNDAAYAVLGSDVITVGGARPTMAIIQTNVTRLPLPRCGAVSPEPTDVTAAVPMPAGLGAIGAQFTEYNDELYVSGGLRVDTNCAGGVTAKLSWNSTTGSGTWTPLASNDDTCRLGAATFVVRDTVTGDDLMVVLGGKGAMSADLADWRAYNFRTNTWTDPLALPVIAGLPINGSGTGTSDGTVGLFMTWLGHIYTFALADGVPTITEQPTFASLLTPTFVFANNRFWAFEGRNLTVHSYKIGEGAWTTHRSMTDEHRAGVGVVAQFNEPTFSDKTRFLYIGGLNSAPTPVYSVEEYNLP